ncbi:GntR family transcriptional regulator [Petroclostridium sp. X23]|uniref:GntR family transcriptional regulator n=1 Tax=Petroclostridium sp. X23 TaxID=3045146 RepID=UPI0024ACA8CE|nr:GntR family transcriptional regulator [Petroclostridium sp. X23]WHH60110.1 GntR family transcriptional regulator [Petroclostridium sp. X23]
MELDTANSRPLYKQLKDILAKAIENGVFKAGERIPTELHLSKTYNVSRITVRNALEELTRDNYLVRKQGKGTFVSTEKLQRSVNGMRSFTEMCRDWNCKPGAKVIKSVIEDANDIDTAELDLELGAKIIVIERIRYADSIPVSLDSHRFPEQFSYLLHEDLNNCSLFELLRNKYNVIFDRSDKTIEIVFASYELAKYLNVSKGYPLLCISSIPRDINGAKTHRSKQFIVGDKFKLIV